MKTLFFLVLTFLISGNSLAQEPSGYFGSFHGAEIQLSAVPTLRRVKSLKANGDDFTFNRRAQFLRMNYKFNYSWVANRKFEINAGYEYANVHSPYYSYYNSSSSLTQDLLEDLTFNKHGFNLHVRMFRKGGLAPIGKFVGFGISYARLSMPDSVSVFHGQSGNSLSNSGFFVRKNEVNIIDTTQLDVDDFSKYSSFLVNISVGRTVPITQNLLLSYNASVNLISLYLDGNGGFNLGRELGPGLDDILSKYSDRPINDDDQLNDRRVLESLRAYNRIRFELGVKYFF